MNLNNGVQWPLLTGFPCGGQHRDGLGSPTDRVHRQHPELVLGVGGEAPDVVEVGDRTTDLLIVPSRGTWLILPTIVW